MEPAVTSPFLKVPKAEWVCANDLCFAIFDSFPVLPGHVLVIPRDAGDMGDPCGGVRHVMRRCPPLPAHKPSSVIDPRPDVGGEECQTGQLSAALRSPSTLRSTSTEAGQAAVMSCAA